jgi:hypothetical protein
MRSYTLLIEMMEPTARNSRLRAKPLDRLATAEELAREVELDHLSPIIECHVGDPRVLLHTRVGD